MKFTSLRSSADTAFFSWRDLVRSYWFLLGDRKWKYITFDNPSRFPGH
ncbi:hypothetical protein HY621_00915 [Candidatus Uhrbacteria bacterium]|nr:hypothetical protein [Candidatus Uhrbacteria bacterium]